MGHNQLIMRIMTTLDTIRLKNEVLLSSSYWTSQISYEAAASLVNEAIRLSSTNELV